MPPILTNSNPLEHERFDEAVAHGYYWRFENRDVLAGYVAQLLLGQHRHVRRILEGTASSAAVPSTAMLQATLNKLSPQTPKQKEHRDGWLFQMIAWIGLRISDANQILVSPPHDRPADKGFDALAILLDKKTGSPKSMMICEEKATTNPRNKFQQQVLAEFEVCKRGERDCEIRSELTTLLEASNVEDSQVDGFLENVMWERENRVYRASLTAKRTSNTTPSKLFKGFDVTIPGDVTLRRAEIYHLDNLREWMDEFAQLVSSKIQAMGE